MNLLFLRNVLLCLLTTVLSGCLSGSEIQNLREENDALEMRIKNLENTFALGSKKIEAAFSESRSAYNTVEGAKTHLDDVKRELESTQGTVDEILLKIKKLQEQEPRVREETLHPTVDEFEDEFTRISRRLSKSEVLIFSLREPLPISKKKPGKPWTEQKLVRTFVELLREKKYDRIIETSSLLLAQSSKQTARLREIALTFRAEAFFHSQRYQRAALDYLDLVENFPESDKVPHALLVIGDSFVNLKKIRTAKSFYMDCIKQFPQREECIASKKRLNAMN